MDLQWGTLPLASTTQEAISGKKKKKNFMVNNWWQQLSYIDLVYAAEVFDFLVQK